VVCHSVAKGEREADYQLAMIDSQVIAAWVDPFPAGGTFANYPNGVHLVRLTP
jgi:hypothetical protein